MNHKDWCYATFVNPGTCNCDQNADTPAAKAHACHDDCAHRCGCATCLDRCAAESAPESLSNSQIDHDANLKALRDAMRPPNVRAAKRAELLDEAKAVVSGPRAANYGPPEDNFRRIAALWTTYLQERFPKRTAEGVEMFSVAVEDHDVAAMMILMKVARIIEDPSHKDSWTDTAGYAACGFSVAP